MKKQIIKIGHHYFAYDSVSAATPSYLTAMIKDPYCHKCGTVWTQCICPNDAGGSDQRLVRLPVGAIIQRGDKFLSDDGRMKLYCGKVAQPKKQRPLGLPAPKRNTIECPACESVAVVRGSNCQSCGTYVP